MLVQAFRWDGGAASPVRPGRKNDMIRAGRRCGGASARGSANALVLAGILAAIIVTSTALAGAPGDLNTAGASSADAGTGSGTILPGESRGSVRLSLTLSSRNEAETGAEARRRFPLSVVTADEQVTRLVALPRCERAEVSSLVVRGKTGAFPMAGESARPVARVVETAMLRDQTVALLSLDAAAARAVCGTEELEIDLVLNAIGATGPDCVDTGPFSRGASRSILNYTEPADAWSPNVSGRAVSAGTVSYISSVENLGRSGPDALFIVGENLASAPAIYALANHHASNLGLNIGIASTSLLAELTPEELKAFIKAIYDTQSASHFMDGHLGFVLLIGDAYADDNQTVMMPKYDGYGGDEEASDHFFACVSGDDDIEDVMIGRLSVGNLTELNNVVSKIGAYAPQNQTETWRGRTLLVGGMFYTLKEDYVDLFDEYDEIIPDDKPVDRIYRHDFGTVQACAEAVTDAINDGYLIVNFAGDGWLSEWHQTLNTTHIDLMDNPTRLPIVLSMACITGWFDNTTEVDAKGSYDCLAEQLVNAPGKGAIACLATPRSSDGGMFRTLTKRIYEAIFEEHSVFIGEMVAVSKLLHLQDGGSVDYVRHFNLLGDPMVVFAGEASPAEKPDLVVSPYLSSWSPDYPAVDGDLNVSVTVKNQSGCSAQNVLLRISGQTRDSSYSYEMGIEEIPPWSSSTAAFTISALAAGVHGIDVAVDPDDSIDEGNESNNTFTHETYAYAHVSGFPLDTGVPLHTAGAARLGADARILVMNSNAQALAVSSSGQIEWQSNPYTEPADMGYEIAPAAGDLNGDGISEVVSVKRMGVTAIAADGSELWSAMSDDVVGYPVVADADGDGDGDVIMLTKSYMWNTSKLVALDEFGNSIWTYVLPGGAMASTFPVAGDFDCDGHLDIAFGTQGGNIMAVTTSSTPPVEAWPALNVSSTPITALACGDLDADGDVEIIAGADRLSCIDGSTGDTEWESTLMGTVVSLALGDLDGDSTASIVAGTSERLLFAITGGTCNWIVSLPELPGTSAAVADVDGDGINEVLVGTADGDIHIISQGGVEMYEPMPIPGGTGTPTVFDINGDGSNEIVASSFDGLLMALELSPLPSAQPDWSGLGGNAQRNGLIAQPFHGTITDDRTLAGRCTVVDNVTIAPSATLLLMPGTELEFLPGQPSVGIDVEGSMITAGTQTAPVRLHSETSSGRGAGWSGISLASGADIALTHTVIEGAAKGISGGPASVTIQNCLIEECETGIDLDSCHISADALEIKGCAVSGALLDGGQGSFENCVFDTNGLSGIEIRGGATYSFESSSFSSTLGGSGAAVYSSPVSFTACDFEDNAENGILVQNCHPTFYECTFRDNVHAGMVCRKSACPTVGLSTFADNYAGVIVETSSRPNLGNDMYPETSGNNSFIANNIALWNNASDTSPVYAKRNWWGTATPYGRLFIGYVIYRPWLTEPPSDNQPKDTEVGMESSPLRFGLAQNTPNPFNPSTFIRYDVPAPGGDVDLAVYDAAGRLVKTLRQGYHAPGTHEAVWRGRDHRNREVASGVYFVRMVAPDFSSSRKMLLLK